MTDTPKLTKAQAAVLTATRRGPLFRRGTSGWGRAGWNSSARAPTVDALVALGFLERTHTRHGVPMVRLTDAGRDAGEGRLNGARRLVEQEDYARKLHEVIAP